MTEMGWKNSPRLQREDDESSRTQARQKNPDPRATTSDISHGPDNNRKANQQPSDRGVRPKVRLKAWEKALCEL
ncbi:hypothetical protein J2046_002584 [Rhizobium petrolearium]|nr:hypothetical protein [Neorhizobium petrolearium]